LRLRAADALDAALARRDPMIPPRRLQFVGNSDFRATGEEFRSHLHRFAQLGPQDRVLDIGCGIGRIARVLASELGPPGGRYDGFDVSATGIAWCRDHYRHTAVAFRFAHVDLHHPEYNPSGAGDAERFRFPYDDDSFDLAIATSVFTHLLDGPAEHYLSEAARVLAPGGRLFATWFVVDHERPPEPGSAMIVFQPTAGAALVADPAHPQAAVAYPLQWIRGGVERAGLSLREPYQGGTWTGRAGASSQDILVADLGRVRAADDRGWL
jgi:SAM-dependent methyltransferase